MEDTDYVELKTLNHLDGMNRKGHHRLVVNESLGCDHLYFLTELSIYALEPAVLVEHGPFRLPDIFLLYEHAMRGRASKTTNDHPFVVLRLEERKRGLEFWC